MEKESSYIKKLIEMFGIDLVNDWKKEAEQRIIDFKEFLKNKNISFEELKEKADIEESRFKDKESFTPEQVIELYNVNESMCFACLNHYPFHSEGIIKDYKPNINIKLLEFGAGLGGDLINFEKRGFTNLHFFEISKICIEFMSFLKKKYQLKINILQELEKDYDIIFSIDVIEHIPNQKEVMEDLFKRLKVGGVFFLGYHFTPKGEEGRPSHYEEKHPISKLFEENGFKQITSSVYKKIK